MIVIHQMIATTYDNNYTTYMITTEYDSYTT